MQAFAQYHAQVIEHDCKKCVEEFVKYAASCNLKVVWL